MSNVVIPYCPRKAFEPFHDRPQRWAVLVCHRRAGKTTATINELIRARWRNRNVTVANQAKDQPRLRPRRPRKGREQAGKLWIG